MSKLHVLIAMLFVLVVPIYVHAEQDDAAEESSAPPPAVEPAPPAPGEEVMRSTTRGIRFTRKMCKAFARQFTKEELEPLGLDDQQREKLVDMIDRRSWESYTREGEPGSQALEKFYEGLLVFEGGRDKSVTADQAREYSEKIRPGVKLVEDFWTGFMEEAKPVLNELQYAGLQEKADEIFPMLRKFDDRMDRWSRGEVKENESLVDGLDEDDIAADKGVSKEYKNAHRSARWEVQMYGPFRWRQFLSRTVRVCKFDERQKADGEKILREYTKKADAIMTKEWRTKAQTNRAQRQLTRFAAEVSLEPWCFHLDREYKTMVEPLKQMDRSFHREILALATAEQRGRIAEGLTKIAVDNGMKATEIEQWFPFPQTQPGNP